MRVEKTQTELSDWVLPVILVIGAIVRLWGINFGLPHTECRPDETAIISRSLQFFSGDFNPHFFIYPTFYMYLLFGVYLVYYLCGQVLGVYGSPDDLVREFIYSPSHLYLIDRSLSALFGVMTIGVVYLLVEKFFNRPAAAIAALFLSLAHLHVRNSHFGVTDVPQTFFIVLAVYFILGIVEPRRSARISLSNYLSTNYLSANYLYAGIFSGLAFSTKYTALPLLGTLLIAHSLKVIAERKEWKEKIVEQRFWIRAIQGSLIGFGVLLGIGTILLTPDFVAHYFTTDGVLESFDRLPALRKILGILSGACLVFFILLRTVRFFAALIEPNLLVFVGSFLAAFLIGTPFALLDPKKFLAGFANVIHAASADPHSQNLGMGMQYHFQFTLPIGLGICLWIAGLMGIAAAFKQNVRRAIVLLTFPLAYYLLMGSSASVSVRYMVPMVPFVCITAAIFVVMAVEQFSRLPIRSSAITVFLVTLILVQPVYAIAQSDRLLATPDNRLIAAEWLRQNAPQGSSIYQTGLLYGQMIIDRSPQLVIDHLNSPQINGQESLSDRIQTADYAERYPQWQYDPSTGVFYFHQKLQKALPHYIVIQENAVDAETLVEAGIAEIIQKSYILRQSFRAMETGDRQNQFDRQDAFYLPYSGFRNVRRPGTNFYIYQRSVGS